MYRILSMLRVRRSFSSLLRHLAFVFLGFPFSSAAHVGIHEDIETLSRLIDLNPENLQLYISRGEAYRLHGNQDSAIGDFTKALDIDPNNAIAITSLGRTYLDQGSYRPAIAYLNRALSQEPGNVRALSFRAQANVGTGRLLMAAADYTRAIEQCSKQGKPLPDYYLQRARAFAAAGDQYIERALQGLDEGITILGNIRTLEIYAVELETRRGNFDAALTRLDSILASATRKEFLLMQRGDILTAADRTAEATRDYLAAQAALDVLPPQRRHTGSVRQLHADLEARLISHGNFSGDN